MYISRLVCIGGPSLLFLNAKAIIQFKLHFIIPQPHVGINIVFPAQQLLPNWAYKQFVSFRNRAYFDIRSIKFVAGERMRIIISIKVSVSQMLLGWELKHNEANLLFHTFVQNGRNRVLDYFSMIQHKWMKISH